MDILRLEHVKKSFGPQEVIRDLNLSVPEHSVFGFLGQNGAGKTTTMKMILGLIRADSGTITVCGEQVRYGETKTNRCVGYLPDVPEFYSFMRPGEYLKLCGEIAGLSHQVISRRSGELLSLVGLENCSKKIGGFSRGMKQRLGIAQALLGDPKLLICDEPTSALDPVGRKEILDILGQVRGKTTVLFSTHILSDVERICDRIAVLHGGRLALCGTLEEIRQKHRSDSLLLEFASNEDMEKVLQSPALSACLTATEITGLTAVLHSGDIDRAGKAVLSVLAGESILPVRLELQEPTLESLFMEAIQ